MSRDLHGPNARTVIWWTSLVVLAVVAVVSFFMDAEGPAVVSGGVLALLLVGWLVFSIPFWVTILVAVGVAVLVVAWLSFA